MHKLVINRDHSHQFLDSKGRKLFESDDLKCVVKYINNKWFLPEIDVVFENTCCMYKAITLKENIFARIRFLHKMAASWTKFGSLYSLVYCDVPEELNLLKKSISKLTTVQFIARQKNIDALQANAWSFIKLPNNMVTFYHYSNPVLDRIFEGDNFETFLKESQEYLYRFNYNLTDPIQVIDVEQMSFNSQTALALNSDYMSILKKLTKLVGAIFVSFLIPWLYLSFYVFNKNKELFQEIDLVKNFAKLEALHFQRKHNFWSNFFPIITKFDEILGSRGFVQKLIFKENGLVFYLDNEAKNFFNRDIFIEEKHLIKNLNISVKQHDKFFTMEFSF